jgi:hypothetical protein
LGPLSTTYPNVWPGFTWRNFVVIIFKL